MTTLHGPVYVCIFRSLHPSQALLLVRLLVSYWTIGNHALLKCCPVLQIMAFAAVITCCLMLQAGEKLSLRDTTKGDVLMKLVPLIDNFEAAKNAIKVQSDAEQKIVDSYQVSNKQLVIFEGCTKSLCSSLLPVTACSSVVPYTS